MFALEALIDRLRTAMLVARGLALVRDLGPYAAIELLLPGGSLIALGLWLYSRHKAGKPLLPFTLRRLSGLRAMRTTVAAALLAARRLRASSTSAMRRMPSFNLLERPLRPRDERLDVPVAGVALRGCSSCG
jgi:hypothetical protein